MILKNLNIDALNAIHIDALNLCLIPDHLSLKHINFAQYDAIVIQSQNADRIRQILFALRSSDQASIYLKPVYTDSKRIFSRFKHDIDELLTESNKQVISHQIQKLAERSENVSMKIDLIRDPIDKFILKALQYVYTRGIQLEPYRTRQSSIGYNFPFLNSIAVDNELIEISKRLVQLSEKSYLKSEILDKVNLCHSCFSSYLNFHETCHKCGSLDLKYENLIHHFRCAYIGPESDFEVKEKLICPKCSKELKHIGIDYDKPSEIAQCNSCDHQSQETHMKASCVDCGEHNSLSQLSSIDIRRFQISQIGEKYILEESMEGVVNQKMDKDLKTVPIAIFNLLLRQEGERVKANPKVESYAGEFEVSEILLKYLNVDARIQFQAEIVKILTNHLRPLDIVCAESFQKYLFLFPDAIKKDAIRYYETLLDNLNKILVDNIKLGDQLVKGSLRKI